MRDENRWRVHPQAAVERRGDLGIRCIDQQGLLLGQGLADQGGRRGNPVRRRCGRRTLGSIEFAGAFQQIVHEQRHRSPGRTLVGA
jgi:hypothetical protein